MKTMVKAQRQIKADTEPQCGQYQREWWGAELTAKMELYKMSRVFLITAFLWKHGPRCCRIFQSFKERYLDLCLHFLNIV